MFINNRKHVSNIRSTERFLSRDMINSVAIILKKTFSVTRRVTLLFKNRFFDNIFGILCTQNAQETFTRDQIGLNIGKLRKTGI